MDWSNEQVGTEIVATVKNDPRRLTRGRERPLIAFFDYHDVFEDFYPRYGVSQQEFASCWSNSGNHAYLKLIREDIGDVIWYPFSLAPEVGPTTHQRVGCEVKFLRSSVMHRALWKCFYGSQSSWRWQKYYRFYEPLASYSGLLSTSLYRALRRSRPDCLFVQDYATGKFDVLCAIARLMRIPIVAYHAGSAPERYVGKSIKPWSLRQSTIITSSRREQRMLAERYRIAPDRLNVVLTPIDVARFAPRDRQRAIEQAGLPVGRRYILFMGRLDDRVKRVSSIISAFAGMQSQHPDVDLLIAGDGPDAESLRRLSESRCRERVQMLGWIGGDDARANLYNAAEFLVLSSRSEGFPTVIGESMACGTPVLATDVGGVSELVNEGQTGWLVAANDIDQFAVKMASLLANPAVTAAARPRARELAMNRVSPAAVSADLVRCFDHAMSGV